MPISLDEDGEAYGACYVLPLTGSEIRLASMPREHKERVPQHAKVYLHAIGIVLGEKGVKIRPFGSEGPELRAVDCTDIRKEFDLSYPADGDMAEKKKDARRKAFARGEAWALDKAQVATREVNGRQMVWLVRETVDDPNLGEYAGRAGQ
ncbi:hypothetical protein KHC28_16155 [Ancylobacter sonchi]|uniref:hypothetical protein n=1 Tax=Ancylobacter sonchi TaxID=1937790 RepID=UPI001BD646ED|nr:hypothetical protein [Ancylobacter sonchi]MBS7535186.1 hypothetical protein [Ancylobacter sonchi]